MKDYLSGLKNYFEPDGSMKKLALARNKETAVFVSYFCLADYWPVVVTEIECGASLPQSNRSFLFKGERAMNEQDFTDAIHALSERLGEDAEGPADPLRALFVEKLEQESIPDCEGILACLNAISEKSLFDQFIETISFFEELAIPLRTYGKHKFDETPWSFWRVMRQNRNAPEQIQNYILLTCRARPVLPAPEQMAMLYASAIMDISYNLYADYDKPSINALVFRRFCNAAQFLTEDAAADLPGYALFPTGSDPHLHGRQVLFADKDGERNVYKPRSMKTDALLTGEEGFFAYLGRVLGEDFSLPLMEISESPSFGMENYVTKQSDFTAQDAGTYYRKMGVLAYAAKLAGATDLHQDNLMPTANGPVIIDAECAFLIPVIASECLDATLIHSALCQRTNALMDDASSFFTIEGKDSTLLTVAAPFYDDFWQGFSAASDYCMANLDEVIEEMASRIEIGPLIRYVPVGTDLLAAALVNYRMAEDPSEVTKEFSSKIREAATRDFSIQNLDLDILEAGLSDSFSQGDIPLLQLQVVAGGLSALKINNIGFAVTDLYNDREAIKNVCRACIEYMADLDKPAIIDAFFYN